MNLRTGMSLVLALGCPHAAAQDEEGWSGQIAFGYLATNGNAESENMNLNFGTIYNAGPWHHNLDGLAVKASANDLATAQAYGLQWKIKYDLNDTDYAFGVLAWNRDEFSAYDRQVREVFGYGRRFIDGERHVWNGETGLGLRQAVLRDGTSEDEAILRVATDYRWTMTDTSYFMQTLAIESGNDNTYLEAAASLHADVWQKIAVVLSYTIKHNTDVPAGSAERDTFTAVSLEYSF